MRRGLRLTHGVQVEATKYRYQTLRGELDRLRQANRMTRHGNASTTVECRHVERIDVEPNNVAIPYVGVSFALCMFIYIIFTRRLASTIAARCFSGVAATFNKAKLLAFRLCVLLSAFLDYLGRILSCINRWPHDSMFDVVALIGCVLLLRALLYAK